MYRAYFFLSFSSSAFPPGKKKRLIAHYATPSFGETWWKLGMVPQFFTHTCMLCYLPMLCYLWQPIQGQGQYICIYSLKSYYQRNNINIKEKFVQGTIYSNQGVMLMPGGVYIKVVLLVWNWAWFFSDLQVCNYVRYWREPPGKCNS